MDRGSFPPPTPALSVTSLNVRLPLLRYRWLWVPSAESVMNRSSKPSLSKSPTATDCATGGEHLQNVCALPFEIPRMVSKRHARFGRHLFEPDRRGCSRPRAAIRSDTSASHGTTTARSLCVHCTLCVLVAVFIGLSIDLCRLCRRAWPGRNRLRSTSSARRPVWPDAPSAVRCRETRRGLRASVGAAVRSSIFQSPSPSETYTRT